MSEDGFSEPHDDDDETTMEIYVETLTGTLFEMKVGPADTVYSIKNKIQRVEGIPVAHQNLIYKMKELEDCRKLSDVGIVNGSRLKLILTMRGGPISTRRFSICDHHFVWKDLKELVESSREEICEKSSSSRISLLVFKEGDMINLLRVIENEDGSFVPYDEDVTAPVYKSKLKEESQTSIFEKLVEDHEMLTKVSQLRQRMDDLSLKRQSRQQSKPIDVHVKSDYFLGDQKPTQFQLLSQNDVRSKVNLGGDNVEVEEIALKEKHRSKFVSMTSPQKSVSPIKKSGLVEDNKLSEQEVITKYFQPLLCNSENNFSGKSCATTTTTTTTVCNENASSSTSSLMEPITLWPEDEVNKLFGVSCNDNLSLSAKSCVKLTRLMLSDNAADRPKTSTVSDDVELEENVLQEDNVWEIHKPPIAEQIKKSAACKISLLKRRKSADCGSENLEGAAAGGGKLSDSNYHCKESSEFEIFGKNVFRVPHLVPTTTTPSAIPPQYVPKEERMTCQYFVGNNRQRSPLYGRKARVLSDNGSVLQNTDGFNNTDAKFEQNCVTRFPKIHHRITSGFTSHTANIEPATMDARSNKNVNTCNRLDNYFSFLKSGDTTAIGKSQSSLGATTKLDHRLPAVNKKRLRCEKCNKRLNITTMYNCRCGKLFCAQHRYSEVHNCKYDYKTEGRKLLEQQNPLVVANKLPKF